MVSSTDEKLSLLVVGDPRGALSVGALRLEGVMVCEEKASAIEMAGSQPFAAMAVVMSSFPENTERLIAELHTANPSARLYLLARMYEEPQAMALVGTCRNGGGPLIADYIICPAEPAEVFRIVWPKRAEAVTPVAAAAEPELVEQLTKMATEDYLTGLKNRRYLDEFLVQIIDRANRTETEVSLLVLDIDGLKHYNDTWGHTVGDSVLKQAAAFIKTCCRSHDVVARTGGDEFAIVFWDMPKDETGEANGATAEDRRASNMAHPNENVIIERFRAGLAGTGLALLGPAGIGTLTMSGGLATYPGDGANADELFLAADEALLKAKRSGKNRIYLVGQMEEGATHEA